MTINTNDRVIKNLIEQHPEYNKFFKEIEKQQQEWRLRYGEASLGSIGVEKEYEDSDLIEKVKKVEIELLKKLLEVCASNGLTVYLMYGSLLGAVRDDGIIYGDDDIDVALMRKDYDKLLELAKQGAFEEPYFFQTSYNDECFYGGYSKLRHSKTSALLPQNWWVNCNEGISIDIFPMDGGYADEKKELRKKKKILRWQRFLYAKTYGFFREFKDMPLLVWKTYKYAGKIWKKNYMLAKLDEALRLGDDDSEYPFGIYTHYLGDGSERIFSKEAFSEKVLLNFEGIKMAAPAGWDRVLADLYGEGYLKKSDTSRGKLRHGFYSVDVPYQNYKRRFNGLFKPMPLADKKIALVGEKEIFELYYNRYSSERYQPDYTIEVKKENNKFIISDTDKDVLSNKESIYLIICSMKVRKIEEIIRELGYREYYVFWHDRNWIQLANYSSAGNK